MKKCYSFCPENKAANIICKPHRNSMIEMKMLFCFLFFSSLVFSQIDDGIITEGPNTVLPPVAMDATLCIGGEFINLSALGENIKWYSDTANPLYDTRDDQIYDVVTIGEQTWMKENLKYFIHTDSWNYNEYGSLDYMWDSIKYNETYGKYYNWEAAQYACPQGWTLPTDENWKEVFNNLGGSEVAGGKMKETGTTHWKKPNTGATNESAFTARAGGKMMSGESYYMGRYAKFWSNTLIPKKLSQVVLWYDRGSAIIEDPGRNKSLNIRCLKDVNTPVYVGNNMPVRFEKSGIYRFYVTQTIDGIESLPDTVILTAKGCLATPPPVVRDTTINYGDENAAIYADGENIRWYSGIENPLYDLRDGQIYDVVTIGNQTWMKENLNYYTSSGSHYYNNDSISNAEKYGRLYTFEMSRQVCPIGWDAPDDYDWKEMINYLGGNDIAGSKLKETGTSHWIYNYGATNESGFTARPGGYLNSNNLFYDVGSSARFWSLRRDYQWHTGYSLSIYGSYIGSTLDFNSVEYSLRCIKDAKEPIFTGNSMPVNYLNPGTYIFYATQTKNGLESIADTVSLTIKKWEAPTPPPPFAKDTSMYNGGKIMNLYAQGENIKWYSDTANPIFDSRDEQSYNVISIGNQTWMKENLNYFYSFDSSQYYNNDSILNAEIYGRLYYWNIARNVCPLGWYLPTDENWNELVNYLGGYEVAGGKMKETGTTHWKAPNTDATNESGFSVRPGGKILSGAFFKIREYAKFWSKSILSNNPNQVVLWYDQSRVIMEDPGQNKALSVRCLKDINSPVYVGNNMPARFEKAGTYKFYVTQTIDGIESVPDTVVLKVLECPITPPPVAKDTTICIGEEISNIYIRGENIKWYTDKNDPLNDLRDGQSYDVVTIGEQTWMKENLNYNTPSGSHYYNNDSIANAEIYGLLYNWEMSRQVCPAGWDPPEGYDWEKLISYLGGRSKCSSKLKETGTDHWFYPNEPATNESGFTARPGGESINNSFYSKGSQAYFWSNNKQLYASHNLHSGYILYNNFNYIDGKVNSGNEDFSLRCIKDKKEPIYKGNSLPINKLNPGSYTFYVTQTTNGLESSADTVTVKLETCQTPPPPPIAEDKTICFGEETTELHAEGENIKWYDARPKTFTDLRDGEIYKSVVIGRGRWMAENLNYKTTFDSYYYNYDSITYAQTYGRLYSWEAAMEACPSDWHLPTDEEWTQLEKIMGSDGNKYKEAGDEHWISNNSIGTDEYGFTVLPGGFRYHKDDEFYNIGIYADFWTSTKCNSWSGYSRSFSTWFGNINRSQDFNNQFISVRCVQNNDIIAMGNNYTPTDTLPGRYIFLVTQTQHGRESVFDTVILTINECVVAPLSGNEELSEANQGIGKNSVKDHPDFTNNYDDFSFTIYPNPAKDKVNIQIIGVINDHLSFKIIDQLGKEVFADSYQSISEKEIIQLNLPHLAAGYYTILITGNKIRHADKLIINQ